TVCLACHTWQQREQAHCVPRMPHLAAVCAGPLCASHAPPGSSVSSPTVCLTCHTWQQCEQPHCVPHMPHLAAA
ncbi:hypothetical protein LSAT2_029850, partial [Lamellibrachia satsuma]